jgi:hypothetical protein
LSETRQFPKLGWALPAGGFLVLLLLAMLFGGRPQVKPGSSYDAGQGGFRAAYLLLDELGYPVARSRRATGGTVRWVLYPSAGPKEARALDTWVRDGGVLVLADPTGAFGRDMGIALETTPASAAEEEPAGGPGVSRLAGGSVLVTWRGEAGRTWADAGGQPFVTIHTRGRGQVWLLNRPEFVTNRLIGKADNGALVCRLAEATLRQAPGQVAFDEYLHGMRDRPGVVELLFYPPTLWVTLQALLLVALLLWHHGPRFGALRPPPPPSRRSAEEFLDAMAALLQRKGDSAEAFRTSRDELRADIERELGLPAGTPADQLAREAELRRGVRREPLLPLFSGSGPPAGGGAAAFVKAMQELETCRHDFFHGRRRR